MIRFWHSFVLSDHNAAQLLIITNIQQQMNFNRIQKYRSERTITQLNYPRGSRNVLSAETAAEVKRNNVIDGSFGGERGNKIQQSTDASQQSYIHAKGITLRDYLYLTASSAKKSSSVDRSKNSSIQSKRDNSKESVKTHKRGDSFSRKEKYQASNAEIFEIVKNDIKKDQGGMQSMLEQLQTNFDQIVEYQRLDNSKMIEIYNFRKVVRENVMKQMKKLNDLLLKIKGNEKQQNPMPIIFQKDEEQKYDAPIEIESGASFSEQISKHRFHNRTYSLKY